MKLDIVIAILLANVDFEAATCNFEKQAGGKEGETCECKRRINYFGNRGGVMNIAN